ncbi:NPCBM/NEW2 domain-containing protein [Kitasatospora sp. NBC_00240]|uniref:NPCBM/NEW2 domain-containing protein n=1 Tax=Kitasatospora sp. NBC_00240 TaxID=2903567 RepID=UPI00225A6EA5|nr:NPCBM/NEW2 domain-containing protein [Kitasatospora sp. NBC_00240]MCX5215879.1 NPCBM/NEW2 domain-containing protein [Kitasatospora sp. NBC_00240]
MTALAASACASGGSSTVPSTTVPPAATSTAVTATGPSSTASTSPAASGPLASTVAGALYLSSNDPLSSAYGAENGAATVNGRNYARSVSLRTDRGSIPTNDAEYNLERAWQTLNATIGVRDDSPVGTALTFEAFVDGRPAFTQTLPLGQSQDLSLDVRGALRLKIVVTYATTADTASYCYGVWGDARLGA